MTAAENLFQAYFKDNLKLNPLTATVVGLHKYDDQLPNFYSRQYQLISKQHYLAYHQRACQIIPENNRDTINLQIFTDMLSLQLRGLELPFNDLPINQMENIFLYLTSLIIEPGFQPLKDKGDLDKLAKRLSHLPELVETMIDNMTRGIRHQRVLPIPITKQVIKQLQELLDDNPFKVLKVNLGSLYGDLKKIINQYFFPQVEIMLDYLKTTYLANSRYTLGYGDMPGGEKMYQHLVKVNTTTYDLSIKAIHKIGLDQTQQVLGQIAKLEPTLSIKNFTKHRKFYKKSPQAILQAFEKVRTYINSQILPKYFGNLFPKQDYEIKAVPKFTEEFNSTAYYMPASINGKRPGCFFVNMRDLKSHPTYNMEVLTLHEGDPGHHYQIALSQENPKIPKFRSYDNYLFNAYIEGWGLYCETLGNYQDGYSLMGRYDYDILRSARLVLDTGIHYYGWSFEKAKAFLSQVTNLTDTEVDSEIYRYCSIPGQALGYKLGELAIESSRDKFLKRCRQKGQYQEGNNLIKFHQKIIGIGPVPLWILDQALENYD